LPEGVCACNVDTDSVWLVLNASWTGSEWQRDTDLRHAGGVRVGIHLFEVLHTPAGSGTFVTFHRIVALPHQGAWHSVGKQGFR